VRRTPTYPLSGRMQAYLERLAEARDTLFREETRKRPAPGTEIEIPEANKKPRLEATIQASPIPTGPVSIAQVFTVTVDPTAQSFDVSAIPQDIVSKLLVPLLRSIDKVRLDAAVNVCSFCHFHAISD
jgi:symplekin